MPGIKCPDKKTAALTRTGRRMHPRRPAQSDRQEIRISLPFRTDRRGQRPTPRLLRSVVHVYSTAPLS
jgi:hypothetical protein